MRLILFTSVFPNRLQPTLGTFSLEIARALLREHDVEVIAPISWTQEWTLRSRPGAKAFFNSRRDDVCGFSVHYPRYWYTPRTLRTFFDLFLWRSIRRAAMPLLQDPAPDAILACCAHPDAAVAVRAAREACRPCVIVVADSNVSLLTNSPARRRCIVGALKSAEAVAAVSHDIRFKLCESGLDPAKIHVVYGGVETQRFSRVNEREAHRRFNVDRLANVVRSVCGDGPLVRHAYPSDILETVLARRISPWSLRHVARRIWATVFPRRGN